MKINFDFFKKMTIKDKVLFLAAIFILGVILITMPMSNKSNKSSQGSINQTSSNYKQELESQLEDILSQVTGIGEIDVMITLESEFNQSVLFNESISESTSSNSNEKNTTEINSKKEAVMIKDSQGSAPYTVSDKYPSVTGVIVVATGADEPIIKSYIIQAVKAALEVPAHKIVVLPKGD